VSSTASPQVGHLSRRVALTATALVGILYLVVAMIIIVWLSTSLTAQLDGRLSRALDIETTVGLVDQRRATGAPPAGPAQVTADATTAPGLAEAVPPRTQVGPPPGFPFGRERATWRVTADGVVTSVRSDLMLPVSAISVGDPVTIVIDDSRIRVAGRVDGSERVIVGESMGPIDDAVTNVTIGLLLITPLLLLGVFFGSLAVGRRVATPIEAARRRQLAFTADASHELRTPLAVIEANASLALAERRKAEWYRAGFERVLAEARRMRGIIDDLLWLARFDAMQRVPAGEPVAVAVLVGQAADRFTVLAESRRQTLTVEGGASDVTVDAPPEWIDQLIGVLLDNACKYSPDGGAIAIAVQESAGRAVLTVDDSGPGIPPERHEQVFDRFHRDADSGGGAGLGLAIADAIVRATGGRWQIGTSPLGGARMSVSWSTTAEPDA
jgi:signal transduction histidine kinase